MTTVTAEQAETGFREACKWLAKTAREGTDQTRWLIERGMLTGDGKHLTQTAQRILDRSAAWKEHLMNTLPKTVKDQLLDSHVHEIVEVHFAREVAEGRLIRLVGDHYVTAADFDPAKHQRATDVRLLEMRRADIEAVATADDRFRHQLKMILAVAELTAWDERGSPAVWLWEREYLDAADGGYEWTEKATRNKKLHDKLKRLPSLFSFTNKRA